MCEFCDGESVCIACDLIRTPPGEYPAAVGRLPDTERPTWLEYAGVLGPILLAWLGGFLLGLWA